MIVIKLDKFFSLVWKQETEKFVWNSNERSIHHILLNLISTLYINLVSQPRVSKDQIVDETIVHVFVSMCAGSNHPCYIVTLNHPRRQYLANQLNDLPLTYIRIYAWVLLLWEDAFISMKNRTSFTRRESFYDTGDDFTRSHRRLSSVAITVVEHYVVVFSPLSRKTVHNILWGISSMYSPHDELDVGNIENFFQISVKFNEVK